jgi:tetratricopeptide (TPR) repeat protein
MYAQQGLDIAIEMNANQEIIIARTVLAALLWRQGHFEQALTQLFEAEGLAEQVLVFRATVGRWLAQVYLAQGNLDRAQDEIQELLTLDMDVLADEAEPIERLRGQVLAAYRETAEAVKVLEASLERLESGGMRFQTGATLLALAGVLSQVEGRTQDATAHAERAREIFAELGATLDAKEAEELLAKRN